MADLGYQYIVYYNVLLYIASSSDNLNVKLKHLYDSELLYVKTKIVIKCKYAIQQYVIKQYAIWC